MKIVLANKYYFLKGGAERYLFDLEALLQRHGHETVPFAMADKRNRESEWSRYFVSPVQTEKVSFGWQGLRTAGRALYSFESASKFARLLDEVRPNLVHIHNIYRQISPSILPSVKNRGIPLVATIHDYAMIAPNYSLFHDGRICEITKPDRYFRAVGHRCLKGSRAASLVAAGENWLHRKLNLYKGTIDRYIAPSRFVKALMGEYGWPEEKVEVLPYGIEAADYQPVYGGDYVLYVGRLSAEKGLSTLIKAAALIPSIPFRIVGIGPEEPKLKALVSALGTRNVEFRGWRSGEELTKEYQGARFMVVPSEWYEAFGLVVLEAYAHGKAVIASQIGGLPEVVRNGETGILASVGNHGQLAEVIQQLWETPELAVKMGRAGRQWIEQDFTMEKHYRGLVEVYRLAGADIF